MADELIDYYKTYYKDHQEGSYCMEAAADTSRVKLIKEYLEQYLEPGDKVLDVGCGDMHLSTIMPQFEWRGIDINTELAQGKAVVHDLMTPPYPFEDSTFDAVVCSEVLEHLWDLRVVQKEVARVLKPDGLYVMSTPNFDWIWYQMNMYRGLLFDPAQSHLFEHIRQYNHQVHEKHLKEAGFAPFEVVGADAHYNPLFADLRMRLAEYVNDLCDEPVVTEWDIDVQLGKAYPTISHTIMILSRNGKSS